MAPEPRKDTVMSEANATATRRRVAIVAVIVAAALAAIVAAGAAAAASSPGTEVSRDPVVAFQEAGDVGGGVLEPGTAFSPTNRGFATLKRGDDWIRSNIHTSGLPAGTYTVWWVIFNDPEHCDRPCDEGDLLNPDAGVSIFFATGGVVGSNGIANFRAHYTEGDDLGEADTQHVLGDGALDPSRAEVHMIIKYHGPPSDDPDLLWEQTHTLLGGCFANANALDLGEPFGIQCFDPQAVAHLP
jgi:hypothetical protein